MLLPFSNFSPAPLYAFSTSLCTQFCSALSSPHGHEGYMHRCQVLCLQGNLYHHGNNVFTRRKIYAFLFILFMRLSIFGIFIDCKYRLLVFYDFFARSQSDLEMYASTNFYQLSYVWTMPTISQIPMDYSFHVYPTQVHLLQPSTHSPYRNPSW